MKINDLKKSLSNKIKKKAELFLKQNAIRELEEIEEDTFVAFVDDNENSFDIKIKYSNTEIKEVSCDCENELELCEHSYAVLLATQKDRINSNRHSTKISAIKKSPIRELLDTISHDEMAHFLEKIFKKNKDIYLQFKQQIEASKIYTSEELILKCQDVVNAVIKKRHTANATEATKIQELIKDMLLPSLHHYLDNIEDEVAAKNAFDIIYKYYILQFSISTNSIKLNNLFTILKELLLIGVNKHRLSVGFATIINNIAIQLTQIPDYESAYVFYDLLCAIIFFDKEDKNNPRLLRDATILLNASPNIVKNISIQNLALSILSPLKQLNFFEEMFEVSALPVEKRLELAEKYLIEKQYNYYIKHVININTILNYYQTAKLVQLNGEYLKFIDATKYIAYVISNYQFYISLQSFNDVYYSYTDDISKAKWLEKITKDPRINYTNTKYKENITLQILLYHNKLRRLINFLSRNIELEFIVENFDTLYSFDSEELLRIILDYHSYKDSEEKVKELVTLIIKKYNIHKLRSMLPTYKFGYYGAIIKEIKEQLAFMQTQ